MRFTIEKPVPLLLTRLRGTSTLVVLSRWTVYFRGIENKCKRKVRNAAFDPRAATLRIPFSLEIFPMQARPSRSSIRSRNVDMFLHFHGGILFSNCHGELETRSSGSAHKGPRSWSLISRKVRLGKKKKFGPRRAITLFDLSKLKAGGRSPYHREILGR